MAGMIGNGLGDRETTWQPCERCDSDVRVSLASDNSSLTDTESSINQTQHSQAAVYTKNPHNRGLEVFADTCGGIDQGLCVEFLLDVEQWKQMQFCQLSTEALVKGQW